jgi:predicted nicotinamide N-methyase
MPFTAQEALYYDLFCAGDNYAAEARELRRQYPSARSVLEIGAGTGLLTRELLKQDFTVSAVEPAPAMQARLAAVAPGVTIHPQTVQEFVCEPHQRYDVIVAHCDVFNYLSHDELPFVLRRLRSRTSQRLSIKIWDPRRGIWPFRYRRRIRARQLRLALRLGRTVHVWFFFWGYGRVLQHHRLYLHDPAAVEALNG